MKIALLGAECTGKSTLAKALLQHIPGSVQVAEYLRQWCDEQHRTPQQHEQAFIAGMQQCRIEAAAETASIVIADTTPLMTAVYSDCIFGDDSLYPAALEYQRSFGIHLVMGLDTTWQADGLQRDGLLMRQAVDTQLRSRLNAAKLPYHVVYGENSVRAGHALDAINSINAMLSIAAQAIPIRASCGNSSDSWLWVCDKCSDPECEHRLFSRLKTQPAY